MENTKYKETSFSSWFAKKREKFSKIISLESAFLTNRYFRYIIYRLRLFFLNSLGGILVHALEFFLIFKYMDKQWIFLTLLFSTFKVVLQGAWWGSLEQMRIQIRSMKDESKAHLIPKFIGRWLSGSFYLALGFFLLSTVGIGLSLYLGKNSFSPFHLYLFSSVLTVSLSFIVRTYHSGAFALRRVYRPIISIVGLRFSAFFLTLLLLPAFPKWGLPIVMLLNSLFGIFLTYHYSARAHKALRHRKFDISFDFRVLWKTFFKRLNKTFYLGALSSALMRFDAKILLFLFYSSKENANSENLFLFFYLIRPIVHMTHEWAQLFYFDSVKLNLQSFQNLNLYFQKNILVTAICMACFCWISSCLVAKALGISFDFNFFGSLGAFFISYSFLSYVQIRSFAKLSFSPIIMSSSCLAIFLFSLSFFSFSKEVSFLALSFLMLSLYMYFQHLNRVSNQKVSNHSFLSISSWVNKIKNYSGKEFLICSFSILEKKGDFLDTPITPRQRLKVLGLINSPVGLSLVQGRKIFWLATGEKHYRNSMLSLFQVFGGSVKDSFKTKNHQNPQHALDDFLENGPLKFLQKEDSLLIENKNHLIKNFERIFSKKKAFVLNLKNKKTRKYILKIIKQKEKQIFQGIYNFSQDPFSEGRFRDFNISALFEADELSLVFIIKRPAESSKIKFWQKAITRFNINYNISKAP